MHAPFGPLLLSTVGVFSLAHFPFPFRRLLRVHRSQLPARASKVQARHALYISTLKKIRGFSVGKPYPKLKYAFIIKLKKKC